MSPRPGGPGTSTRGAFVHAGFFHPALFYRDEGEYLAGTVPFVRAGREAGEPVAVAVPGERLATLRDALGRTADEVSWLDMSEAGRNPGRIIPGVLRDFADRHAGGGRVRIIGEPIWPGRSATEYPACAQHEALINLAFAGRGVSILCPYDVSGLDEVVIADARATHPVLIDRHGEHVSGDYAPHRVISAYNRPLPEPPGAVAMSFDLDALPLVREFVTRWGARLGLGPRAVGDLELAANELAANSCLHGGGAGTARLWSEDGQVVFEVRDAGTITDPLAGRRPADMSPDGGRGILMVNHLADLVRMHTGPDGTTVRIYMRN
ncbi:anti-sigma factor RsbA family regulatory protein [Actinomadura sp. 3N508]|uniref:anti-sigma factor RsbA family regulatory protein n=1 Tax=Actinomadura sp. 3N508 TaxID=3375153 RepID=UPI0037969574